MSDGLYPAATRELAEKRRSLAPEAEAAFQAFSQKVFAEGALPVKIKQLIAVAVAHTTHALTAFPATPRRRCFMARRRRS